MTTRAPYALGWVLACLCVLFAVNPLGAHVPPMVNLEVTVDEEAIDYKVLIFDQLYEKWFDKEYEQLREISDADQSALAPEFEAFMTEFAPVAIDGVTVPPRLESVIMRERMEVNDDLSYVEIRFRYGTKGDIRQLSLVWRQFKEIFALLEAKIPMLLKTDEYMDVEFTEKEPEFIWHAPLRGPVLVEAPPEGGVPVASLSIVGLLLLAFPLLRRSAPRGVVFAIMLVALGSSFATAGMARVELSRLWSVVPDNAEAAEIFESLLRNIYRAFDYEREEAIYDSLQESVAPSLLESIYVEVYTSLVMKEQGGAVARVKAVKILKMEKEGGTRDSYDLICEWQVQGTVEHWAHTHLRTNRYSARFTVAWIGGGWRISNVEILSQERTGN